MEGGDYEHPAGGEDPMAALRPEERTLVDSLVRSLRFRGPEDQAQSRLALIALLRPSPATTLDPATLHIFPDPAFRRRLPPLLASLRSLHSHLLSPSTPPASQALRRLHLSQLHAYTAMAFKSKEERLADKNAARGSASQSSAIPLRYEKTSFDEPAEWLRLGFSGYTGAGSSASITPSPTSPSVSATSSQSNPDITAVHVAQEEDREVLGHAKLRDLRKASKKSEKKKKKKRIVKANAGSNEPDELTTGEELASDDAVTTCAGMSAYEKPSLDELARLEPRQGNLEPATTRSAPFARPTPTRENCFKRIKHHKDVLPSDAYGRVVEEDGGVMRPTFVGLWYRNGQAVFGRVWAAEDGLHGAFPVPVAGVELEGLVGSRAISGAIDVLCYPSHKDAEKRMGFEYAWLPLATVRGSKEWSVVSVGGAVPSLLSRPPPLRFGSFFVTNDVAAFRSPKSKTLILVNGPILANVLVLARRNL